MSDWRCEGIPDKIPKDDGRFLDLSFWMSEDVCHNYLELHCGPEDLLDVITSYYGYKLKEFEIECERTPYDKWDSRNVLCSYSITIFMELLRKLSSQDYDYIEDMADDIGMFYKSYMDGYLITKQRGDEAKQLKTFFLVGIRMMQDLMDYIYMTIGLPID